VYQVLQRVTLQACRGHGIRFANTFQILEEAVQDAFLASARQIPRGRADGSRSFDEAVAIRLGWLWDDAIRAAFYNPPLGVGPADPWTANDAINLYGLPMSIPEDYGPFVSQRFQRIAFQRWKVDHPAGIFAAGFFGFLLSFNELPFSIFMRAGQDTLPLYLWIQSGAHNTTVPLIYAMSTLVTLVSIGLTFLAIKLAFGGGRDGK